MQSRKWWWITIQNLLLHYFIKDIFVLYTVYFGSFIWKKKTRPMGHIPYLRNGSNQQIHLHKANIIRFFHNLPVIVEEGIFKSYQCIFAILLWSPLGKGHGPTWIPFSQRCFLPSLLLKKINKCCQCFFALMLLYYLPLNCTCSKSYPPSPPKAKKKIK